GLFAGAWMIIAQAALVAANPLGDALGRIVEGGIGVPRRRLPLQQQVAMDMDRYVGAQPMRLARKDHMRLDRLPEIFLDHSLQRIRDMLAKGIADIDLLTRNGELH